MFFAYLRMPQRSTHLGEHHRGLTSIKARPRRPP